LDYEKLKELRSDLIRIRLTGNYDDSAAVDYTVNSASGFPIATGYDEAPVNHVLPAWDVISVCPQSRLLCGQILNFLA
jgi:2-methylfumaryl-CoA isomerase